METTRQAPRHDMQAKMSRRRCGKGIRPMAEAKDGNGKSTGTRMVPPEEAKKGLDARRMENGNGRLVQDAPERDNTALASPKQVEGEQPEKGGQSESMFGMMSLASEEADTVSLESEGIRTEELEWSKEKPNKIKRTLEIWSFIIRLRVGLWWAEQAWSYPGGKIDPELQSERRRNLASYARNAILRLGPTFIKARSFHKRSLLFYKLLLFQSS